MIPLHRLRKTWHGLLTELLCVEPCQGCGGEAGPLCSGCWPELAEAGLQRDGLFCAGLYQHTLKRLVLRLKNRSSRPVAAVLAQLLLPALLGVGPFDSLVYIPPSRPGQGWSDGPVPLLAQELGARLGCRPRDCLRRAAGHPPQKGLGGSERRRNAQGLFSLRAPAGERVLLVDDVTTTGSSLRAAGRLLRSHGSHEVYAAVAAYQPLEHAGAAGLLPPAELLGQQESPHGYSRADRS